ncbi:hypothetical protein Bbelb_358230 [Branchiostoma belcheri]|nr:hypothetical protein Bbelb_358230 [Branchiostoma belcheri]
MPPRDDPPYAGELVRDRDRDRVRIFGYLIDREVVNPASNPARARAVLGKTWGEITPDDFHWERRLVDRIYRDVRSPRSRLSPQNASSYLRNVSGLLLVHRGNVGGRSGNEISPDDLIGDETLTILPITGELSAPPAQITEQLLYMYFPG